MKKNSPKNIVVLSGSWNGEREVSLGSGREISAALRKLGHQVREVDLTRDLPDLLKHLNPRPDLVFNAMHGRWVEDGVVQGILEFMKIPYTHSGVLPSAVAMEKPFAKAVLKEIAQLPVIEGREVETEVALKEPVMAFPYVLKPTCEGSSLGVHVIRSEQDLASAEELRHYRSVMCETYIPGRELSVAVMGDKALGVLELEPVDGFYDYTHKYTDGKTIHHMPARVPVSVQEKLMDMALRAHKALRCEGISRTDFRYDDTNGEPGKPYVLEVNTQPGMVPLSIVPEIAAYKGYSFKDLVQWIVDNARCPE